jgi:hypothetical protein
MEAAARIPGVPEETLETNAHTIAARGHVHGLAMG